MATCIVLGGGMVGRVIAADLARDFDVTIADINAGNLKKAAEYAGRAAPGRTVRTQEADLSGAGAIGELVKPFDLAVGALSSRIGLRALREVIEAGRNYCDISFMAQDSRELDALAKQRGVTCVTDCGVAPGMSNLLAAHGARLLDQCAALDICVGGLPRERRWPFEYKAGFSPADVIEEYTRPARLVEHGRVVVREALSEPELLDFDGIGTLEAFNTDGLRSLADALKVPFMRERTLRYPGHIELMRVLRAMGLFSETPVRVEGAMVKPLALTSALLFPMWEYQPGEQDLTVMRVEARGTRGGRAVTLRWDLMDLFHQPTGATSMSRTTAFPCAIVARLIHSGRFRRAGVFAPETLAEEPGLVDHVLRENQARGVEYVFREIAGA